MMLHTLEQAAEFGLNRLDFVVGNLYVPSLHAIDIVQQRLPGSAINPPLTHEAWYRVQRLLPTGEKHGVWALNGSLYKINMLDNQVPVTSYHAYMYVGRAKHADLDHHRNLFFCGDDYVVFDHQDMDRYFLCEKE